MQKEVFRSTRAHCYLLPALRTDSCSYFNGRRAILSVWISTGVSSINHHSGIDLRGSEYKTLKLTVQSLHSLSNFRKPRSFLWMWKPNISTEVTPFPANFLPFLYDVNWRPKYGTNPFGNTVAHVCLKAIVPLLTFWFTSMSVFLSVDAFNYLALVLFVCTRCMLYSNNRVKSFTLSISSPQLTGHVKEGINASVFWRAH